jgi:hypothetical protein
MSAARTSAMTHGTPTTPPSKRYPCRTTWTGVSAACIVLAAVTALMLTGAVTGQPTPMPTAAPTSAPSAAPTNTIVDIKLGFLHSLSHSGRSDRVAGFLTAVREYVAPLTLAMSSHGCSRVCHATHACYVLSRLCASTCEYVALLTPAMSFLRDVRENVWWGEV